MYTVFAAYEKPAVEGTVSFIEVNKKTKSDQWCIHGFLH
jgi:hypothetical protein